MANLKISKEISLPLEVVTQTIAILAKRRAGKSYTMRRLVEQLFKASQQVVLVDPKGDQWGIRSSADGKEPGLPIIILGGEHGDAPLEVNAGEVVAKLVVEERASVLLDLSPFRKHEVATFMTAFLENLYRLKAKEEYRTPVMLVIDEADAIAPQKPQRGEERMLGAAEDIVRRGGQRGIGCCLVTQRSAVLNKNVLTQAQMLIVLRTIAPQDLAAMKAWIEVHGSPEEGKVLMDSLPSLPIGDAWFWSPGWPTNEGIFQRTHILPIETFDSGATPKPGEKKVVPKNLADVDINVLKKQMAATIEKAKKDDPKMLRARIAELERESKTIAPVQAQEKVKEKVIEIPVLKDAQIKKLESVFDKMVKEAERHGGAMGLLWGNFNEMGDALLKALEAIRNTPTPKKVFGLNVRTDPKMSPRKALLETPRQKVEVPTDGELSGPEQRILDAIAWLEDLGINHPEQVAVAFLAGYKYGGGAFNNPKGSLRGKGMVDYPGGNLIALTDLGRQYAQHSDTPLTTEELHNKVLARLSGPEQRILKPLLANGGEALSGEDLAEQSGYAYGAGSFNNPKGRLRSLGLIEYLGGGQVRARDILFIN